MPIPEGLDKPYLASTDYRPAAGHNFPSSNSVVNEDMIPRPSMISLRKVYF